jgi:glycine betaine/proline transport system substrate-binding protein
MSISIAVVAGWDEDIAATYLWKELLEQEGYEVKVQDLDVASTFTGVANGQVDLYLDAWLPTTHETYWEQFGDDLAVVSSCYEPADPTSPSPSTSTMSTASPTSRVAPMSSATGSSGSRPEQASCA